MLRLNKFYISQLTSPNELATYLQNVDGDYSPRLSSLINIEEYSQKLCHKGVVLALYSDEPKSMVGVVAGYCNDDVNKRAFVSQLHVVKDVRRFGNGNYLMNDFFKLAKMHGMKKLSLMVNRDNLAALKFYLDIGFTMIAETVDQYEMIIEL